MNSKPSLADKLKSLGVKKGIPPLSQGKPFDHTQGKPDSPAIDSVVRGSFLPTPRGEVFVAEQNFPQDYYYGNSTLLSTFPLSLIAQWASDEKVSSLPVSKFAFLDRSEERRVGKEC